MKKENLNRTILQGKFSVRKTHAGQYCKVFEVTFKDGTTDSEIISEDVTEKDYFLYKLGAKNCGSW